MKGFVPPKGSTLYILLYKANSVNSVNSVNANTDTSADEEPEIYTYSALDFGKQDYDQSKDDIISAQFLVQIKDKDGNVAGQISWQSLAPAAQEPVVNDQGMVLVPWWSVQETAILSLGLANNSPTWSGSALSEAPGGYYAEGTEYHFHMRGEHYEGYGKEIDITITNVGNGVREIALKPHNHTHDDDHDKK